jgi:filamentous hemagglutinin
VQPAPTAHGIDAVRDAAVRDSRGRIVPPGVKRLPSGKYPANFEYAGRIYDGPRWTPKLGAKYPRGVRFTEDGFPDFAPYATAAVTFEPHFTGDRGADRPQANQKAGLVRTPDEFVWHHHQDGSTMLLVPEDLHEAVRHAGGVSIMKGRA